MYILKYNLEDFVVDEIFDFELDKKGKYSWYLLKKKNIGTEETIQKISKITKLPRKKFSYAGSKDKFAVTSQVISVLGTIREIKSKNIILTKQGYSYKPVSLGDHLGNRFRIVVRNITKKPQPVSETINYFDEQRFGRCNFEIGKFILKMNFRSAAKLIDDYNCTAYLEKYPNDYIGAIRKVPFKIQKLYVASVQSQLWNEVAAKIVILHSKDYFEVKNNKRRTVFTNSKMRNQELPLLAFDTTLPKNQKIIYDEILDKYKLILRDFVIRQIPDLTPKGDIRNLVVKVNNLSIGKLEKDEFSKKKKLTIEFDLMKGSYATIVIKHLFSQ